MHSKLVFVVLHTALLFPSVLTQNQQNDLNVCRDSYQCGTIDNISYPFWGGDQPLSCGYPGFQTDCRDDDAALLLNISSLVYRVLEIDYSSHTLRVARQDLRNTTCPATATRSPLDTTLTPGIFEFPANSSNEDVTLYYDCAAVDANALPNQFTCNVDGVTTLNVFRMGRGASSGPGTGVTCNSSISIPVAAWALRGGGDNLSINVLSYALASGFYVRWSADSNSSCESCHASGGTCGCDGTVCYMESQGSVQVWGVCHVGDPQGWPPDQSPAYPVQPPQSSGFDPNGNDVSFYDRGSSHDETGQIIGLVLGVTGAALSIIIIIIISIFCCIRRIIIIIISIFCCIRRRRSRDGCNGGSNLNVEKFLLQHGSLALKRYKYSEIKKMTKSLSDKLGQGGYGSVYKGKLPNASLVAVKVLNDINSNGEEFINEVASISRTSHVNIVNLLGFCFDGKGRALVYEYMPNKSLDKYMGNTSGADNLDLETLYKIAVGVAKGLEYLHTGCNTKIVHFDIKPQNILLDEDFCPKISDFGLAKLCKKKQSLLSVLGTRGTIGYIAPEIFSRNFGGVSHKSDVYSYGMMVLEMAGANTIVDQTEMNQSSENYFPDKIYEHVIADVNRRTMGEFTIEEEGETARKMFLVGFWCIQTNPSDRPSISKVLDMLEGSVESIQIPPKPVLFTPTLPVLEFSSSFSSYVDTEPSAEGITQIT